MSCCDGIMIEGKLAEHGLKLSSFKQPISGSVWSRNTTAESSFLEELPGFAPVQRIPVTPTTSDLEEMLAEAVKDLDFAVTISGRSAHDAAPVVCAVSRGFEETSGWSSRSLVGGSGRIHEVEGDDCDPSAEMKTRLAHSHGAQASVVQTQRKASGELYAAFNYHRGLSFGSDPITGEERWYLVTVSFDVTEEMESEMQGEGFVDHPFYEEASSSIASQIKASITDALSAWSIEQAWAQEMEEDDCLDEVSVMTPGWVSCPPASKLMTDTLLSVSQA